MFAMFHLGRMDVLPVGDLGVRNGMKLLYGLPVNLCFHSMSPHDTPALAIHFCMSFISMQFIKKASIKLCLSDFQETLEEFSTNCMWGC